MKPSTSLSLLAIGALTLTACGGTDPDDLSQEQREEVARDVLAREMFDCEEGESTDECEERYGQELSDEFEEAMDQSVEEESSGRMTEAVEAEVGEAVEVDLGPFVEGNPYAGVVTLSGVEFSDTCVYDARDGSSVQSEAGSFVHLTFEIETDAEAEDPIDLSNSNEYRWDDYHYALSTPESLDCELDLGHQDPIEPGETGEYTAVWDVPSTEAELQWTAPTYSVTWQIDGDAGEARHSDGAAESSDEEQDAEAAEPQEQPAPEQSEQELPPTDDHYDDHALREGMTIEDTYDDEWDEAEWEDPGYVSRYEEEEAMTEGECPVGQRNLSPTGLDCQPLDVSFEEYADENNLW